MSNKEIIKFQSKKFYNHPNYKKYFASKDGQILSLKYDKKRILKLQVYGSGYYYFKLCDDNIIKNYSVSRFVYECFKGNIPDDKEVDHIDNDKKNNNIKNLQLLTHKENVKKSHFRKEVKSFNIETREEKKFQSIKQASEETGISSASICLNCKKKTKVVNSKKDGMIYIFSYLDKSI